MEVIMSKKLVGIMVTALLLLSLSNISFSQDSPMKFGVRGGLNLANTNEGTPEGVDKKMRTTFGVGGVLEYCVSPMFAIQVNALYNMKGVKFKGTESVMGQSYEFEGAGKYTYLSIPIFAKVPFGQGTTRPYIILGPEIGILLSAKAWAKVSGVSADTDVKEHMKSFEFALNFGAGIGFPIGSMSAFVEGRYGLGLTNTWKESEDSIKNSVIYINLGILLGQ